MFFVSFYFNFLIKITFSLKLTLGQGEHSDLAQESNQVFTYV